MVQTGFLVPLFAGVAIALSGKAAKARLAVWEVLLSVYPVPGVVRDEYAIAKLVGVMELRRRAPVAGPPGADVPKSEPEIVVEDMDGVGFTAPPLVLEPFVDAGTALDQRA